MGQPLLKKDKLQKLKYLFKNDKNKYAFITSKILFLKYPSN
ncbi:hypothetical protein [Clostridium cochlearium]|nr:hypothetical protein [Clostridium cochlearium]SNV78914.1 Uncharacterised protein [Clostridium cochlearium]STA92714.1 Uncharacterised protein [Clostridium cochlearium]